MQQLTKAMLPTDDDIRNAVLENDIETLNKMLHKLYHYHDMFDLFDAGDEDYYTDSESLLADDITGALGHSRAKYMHRVVNAINLTEKSWNSTVIEFIIDDFSEFRMTRLKNPREIRDCYFTDRPVYFIYAPYRMDYYIGASLTTKVKKIYPLYWFNAGVNEVNDRSDGFTGVAGATGDFNMSGIIFLGKVPSSRLSFYQSRRSAMAEIHEELSILL